MATTQHPLERPAIIYKATNLVNGHFYIGVTSRTLARRRYGHLWDARKGKPHPLARAIRKYGATAFAWTVIAKYDTGAMALRSEVRLIAEQKPTYNAMPGGRGLVPTGFTDDGRRRISEAHKGNKYRVGQTHTVEVREQLRVLGIRDRDKWRQRSHLGPAASAKRVVCIDDGMVYPSASAAAAHYGACKSAVIEVCLRRGYRHTAAGRVFRYAEASNGASA